MKIPQTVANHQVDATQAKAKAGGTGQRFLTFTLGEECYAIPLPKVREVIAHGDLTQIPNTPAHFKGIINLRGHVISVIDLRLKFKMQSAPVSQETAIIILDLSSLFMGIMIDSVDTVLTIASGSISPSPEIESAAKSDYIVGVAHVDKKLVLILDIEKTLSVEDLIALKAKSTDERAA